MPINNIRCNQYVLCIFSAYKCINHHLICIEFIPVTICHSGCIGINLIRYCVDFIGIFFYFYNYKTFCVLVVCVDCSGVGGVGGMLLCIFHTVLHTTCVVE